MLLSILTCDVTPVVHSVPCAKLCIISHGIAVSQCELHVYDVMCVNGVNAGSPAHVPAVNGFDLEELKRKAQLHMQQNLAQSNADNSNAREVNGQRKGTKREAGLDNGARSSHHGAKRSRLAVSGVQGELGQQPSDKVHTSQQQPTDAASEDQGYQSVMQMAQQVQANRVSRLARDAKECLRNLDAAEGIGVIAWLIDGMLTQRTDEKSQDVITDWVSDLGSFIQHRTQRGSS